MTRICIDKGCAHSIIPREDWAAETPTPGLGAQRYTSLQSPALFGGLASILKRIIFHHTAFPSMMPPLDIQRYAMGEGLADIPYHFYITGDGQIFEGRQIDFIGAHAGRTVEADRTHHIYNDPDFGSIGIAVAGSFEYAEPNSAQKAAMLSLVEYLRRMFPGIKPKDIMGHKDVRERVILANKLTPNSPETVCPGRIMEWIEDYVAGANGAPTASAISAEDAGPPKEARERIIYYLPDALKRDGEKILGDPASKAGNTLLHLASLAEDEKDMMSLFSFAIPALIKWGVIKNLADLGGSAGQNLAQLMKMASGGFGAVVHGVISNLIDSNAITPKEFSNAFRGLAGWLTGLAWAAGGMDRDRRWQALYFGIDNLRRAGIVKQGGLDEIFRYEEGSALYEMARATKIVDMPQDYFGVMFGDWLALRKDNPPDAMEIGKFFRETAAPARSFYEAGRRQRKETGSKDDPPAWRQVSEKYSDILPMDDIPKILPLLARVFDNPLDEGLANYVSERRNYKIIGASSVDDLRRALDYVSFLEWLTQTAGLRKKWAEERVPTALLGDKFRKKDPNSIFDVAMTLNSFSNGFGDEWVKKAKIPVPVLEGIGTPITVPISFRTFQQVYKKFYLIRLLRPDDIEQGKYKLVWQNGVSKTVAVADLADVVLMFNWITDMLGDDEARAVIGNFSDEAFEVDVRDFPDWLTRLGWIHDARTRYNEQSTGTEQIGDTFIRLLARAVVSASVVSNSDPTIGARGDIVSIDTMVKLLKGWSDLREARISRDMFDTYTLYVSEFAAKIQSYFDENRGEFEMRADRVGVAETLKRLERPLWFDRPKGINDELMELLK